MDHCPEHAKCFLLVHDVEKKQTQLCNDFNKFKEDYYIWKKEMEKTVADEKLSCVVKQTERDKEINNRFNSINKMFIAILASTCTSLILLLANIAFRQ